MNIAVIAANGRAGKVFVRAALDAGHSIRAGVRGDHSFQDNENLTIVRCDATNPEEIATLITGQDAVVSLIGHVKGSPADVQTHAIETIVSAMKDRKIRRIISLTGTGVRFPDDKITFIDRFLNLGVGIVDPKRVKDGKDHVEVLKRSDLDWTVIRVLKLQNVPPKPFLLSEHGPTKHYVGREEVAQAILQVLEQHSFVQQAPIISPA